eukprot:UN27547
MPTMAPIVIPRARIPEPIRASTPDTEGEKLSPMIVGYSGRFPDCESVQEFWKKLSKGIDMVGPSKRYPEGYNGLPARAGHLKNINKF